MTRFGPLALDELHATQREHACGCHPRPVDATPAQGIDHMLRVVLRRCSWEECPGLEKANTYWRNGYRSCRACNRHAQARRRIALAEASA